MCGGTVVARKAILTAAHCLFWESDHRWASSAEIYILHGAVSIPNYWSLKYHAIESFAVHYNYNPQSNAGRGLFDVALIKPVDKMRVGTFFQKSIIPLCRVDGGKWKKLRTGVAIGLGLIDENPSSRPQALIETVLERIFWTKEDFDIDLHPIAQYCYGSSTGSALTEGDFGGPLVFKRGRRASCLIGVASFTLYSQPRGYIANIFTQAGFLKPWVRRVIRENFTDNRVK